eukprot:CAMPEP_0201581212 /NCGR_PEP_ID=MMETSP0190_2-20130828/64549_1 /ASSEMBLY_ACC=CAM_ASM_000263 /TAXON_ID=37353 /ORGANISM="Rosalina sp." /LENGTH=148 /DNA_ID=CAMNT_0048018683 /DNA_START=252 /DNA_END=699 /DNA_ORIENTATION=-
MTTILFDLFPSIFMPYLGVDTFCNLLKTDLWDWQYLLSDRIIYDYCHHISLKYKSEIQKFCEKPFDNLLSADSITDTEETESYDSSDTIILTTIDDEQQEEKEEEYSDIDDDEIIDDSAVEEEEEDADNFNLDFIIKDMKDEEQTLRY